ncbi:hypothetical protein AHF37_03891 [Paragonimus kellicotti]|nr:hypothetical protein AHF37_03891 [Paragonimus kellicotti]
MAVIMKIMRMIPKMKTRMKSTVSKRCKEAVSSKTMTKKIMLLLKRMSLNLMNTTT